MATSRLISLQVSDIIQWFRNKELVINRTFQRHSVWTAAAKTYLIDTILNELPIPKIYLRTKLNPVSQTAIREIVDGQQRVLTLIDFANDKLKLSKRSENYQGFIYSDLDSEMQNKFLGYTLGVEQLMNATDDDVIDIFSRLNSYTVSLNAAEKRHAKFQTEFKAAVRKTAQDYVGFWENYGIFTVNQRFRMADDVLMAEIYGVLIEGVKDGGSSKLDSLYKRQSDETFTDEINIKIRKKIDEIFNYFDSKIGQALHGEFSKHYHLLMMIAAFAHNEFEIPQGEIKNMPARQKMASPEKIMDRLAKLEIALSEEEPTEYKDFVIASSSSTHRMSSREVRFSTMHKIFSE